MTSRQPPGTRPPQRPSSSPQQPGGPRRPILPPLQVSDPGPPDEGPVGTALLGGAVAGLLGAGVWAVLCVLTEYEVSWFAWGVGALVGYVMSRLTPVRNIKLGVYAAVLAVLGLAVGKVMTFQALLPKYGREILLEHEELLVRAFAHDMFVRETYSAEISHQLATLPHHPDSLPERLRTLMIAEAEAQMEAAPATERDRVARRVLERAVREIDIPIQFWATLSLFDFIWFGLALATAWKLMRGG